MNQFENFRINLSSDGGQYNPLSVRILLNSTLFFYYLQKLYFDPYVLFLVTAAMFFNVSKIFNDQLVQEEQPR